MIAWLMYSLLIAALLTLGAHAAERLLRLQGRQTRRVWVAALIATLVVPAAWPQLPRLFSVESPALVPPTFSVQLDAVAAAPSEATTFSLAGVLTTGWVVTSIVLLLFGAVLLVRLAGARRRWRRGNLDGTHVLFSESVGPAVIGFVRPEIVVPEWVASLPAAELRLVLAHERQHIAARDPLTVLFAWLLPVLLPWNPFVWVQSRRLRESIELDCDARLLAGATSATGYAELLLTVGRRTSGAPLGVAALAEPRSLLEKRIRRMFEKHPERRVLHAGAWATVGALAIVAALQAPLPGEPLPEAIQALPEAIVMPAAADVVADTTPPRLLNGAEVQNAARSHYPALLRDAGISGTPYVHLFVDATGKVTRMQISRGSGQGPLDDAALRVAAIMRFAPAVYQGRPVGMWIEAGVEFAGPAQLAEEATRARQRAEAVDITAEPTFTPMTAKPMLQNAPAVAVALHQNYPPLLRDAGIGGTVSLWFFIDENGKVVKTQLKTSSGHPALDEAARQVAQTMEFTPAKNRDETVKVWVDMPIVFRTQEPDGGAQAVAPAVRRTPVAEPLIYVDGVRQNTERAGTATPAAQVRAGGRADLAAGTAASAPVATALTVQPRLQNQDVIARALQRYYPPLLRDAGIGGTVVVWFYIGESGLVEKVQLKESSGHAALDDAALKVAELMQFSPGQNGDRPVAAWVDMPIAFRTQ